MFSTRGPAPEYDLSRFDHTGPVAFPQGTRTVLVLDLAALDLVGDRSHAGAIAFGDGWRMWAVHGGESPLAFGRWIYLHAEDCPCEGASAAVPVPVPAHPL